jgi:putative membrane protein
MLGLVAAMLRGFHLAGFGAAFWSAFIVSITSWIGSWFIGPRGRIEIIVRKAPGDDRPD